MSAHAHETLAGRKRRVRPDCRALEAGCPHPAGFRLRRASPRGEGTAPPWNRTHNVVVRSCLAPFLLVCALLAPLRATEDFFDRVEDALTFSAAHGRTRARLSGTLDLEGYRVQLPAPGVLETADGSLFEPRLTLFVDAQFGPHVYAFAQARADHGFDPGARAAQIRLDEIAVRLAPGRRREFNLQIGRFATVVGNWATRHGSWSNPFITAPLPYEYLTGIWDTEAIRSSIVLLQLSHVRPGLSPRVTAGEKALRIPIVWGPSYADGLMLSDAIGRFRYAFEAKLGSLSSRPEAWRHSREQRHHPTFSGRVAYRPGPAWQLGLSASRGAYLLEFAGRTLAPGHGRGAYRQSVIAGDAAYAWRHWQLWAEVYAARFEIPLVGDAGTVAYYAEAKYKFSPRWVGAVRWNQQLFGTIPFRGADTRWGHNVWRIDVAPAYRFSSHTQLKLQYGLQRGDSGTRSTTRTLAAQFTLRF